MKGQLSLFSVERDSAGKTKKRKEDKKLFDPSQTFEERMKRYWHYMDTKGMNEQWIETCVGELRIIIEALADYCDIAGENIEMMEIGYSKSVWEDRLERIRQIRTKLEESIRYSRDDQLEICKKRKKIGNDIGEDALVLASRK